MGFSNWPNGVTSFGIPVIGAFPVSVPGPSPFLGQPGAVLFVDANVGSDGGDGSLGAPFATIGRATAFLTGRGDTIFVFFGSYSENVVIVEDYVSIIGASYAGYGKPDIGAATGVGLVVTGQGFRALHCRFFATNNSDTVRQQGNGFFYGDCVFDGNAGQVATGLLRLVPSNTDDSLTASEGRVADCYFRGSGSTTGAIIFDTATAAVGVGSTDDQFFGNVFVGNTGPDIAAADTGVASTYSVQRALIQGNVFMDKNKATYIDFTTANGGPASAQNGAVNGNYFATDTMSTTKIKAVGTGFTFAGNYDTVGIFDGSGLD